MFKKKPTQIEQRIKNLEAHLGTENPVLLQVVQSFRKLDRIAYRMGLLGEEESYATRVPWWPLISVLGTYSSGKSTFLNQYLRYKLQQTGNQAVDDRFTVICYSNDGTARVLPGLALDADPRFPFYQISADIERVAAGEGRRVDAYLQLKTCPSEKVRGKILIDSPGFDADAQRTSTLRITDRIMDLSDLVLVFFDARHPEPGAMPDTLQHLVRDTIGRSDSNKFLYILNQIDTAAREDNPEEVVAAWQRALAERGLTAGRFYRIYDRDAAVPIPDEGRRARYEAKRDEDQAEIYDRMHQVEVERAYRIIGVLEKTGKSIENELVPQLHTIKETWKRRTLGLDGILFGVIIVGLFALSIWAGYWKGLRFDPPWMGKLKESPIWVGFTAAGVVAVIGYLHFSMRKLAAAFVIRKLNREIKKTATQDALIGAFRKNIRPLRSIFGRNPAGWGRKARRHIAEVLVDADRYVQTLNDQFANPSGSTSDSSTPAGAPAEAHQSSRLGGSIG